MPTQYEILMCHTEDGRNPVLLWLDSLDAMVRARVRARIDRIEDGNFGDVRAVGEGVSELRMDFGPGYRLYFGCKGKEIHLIRGGDKSTQTGDIADAKDFWKEHE